MRLIDADNLACGYGEKEMQKYGNDFDGGVLFALDFLSNNAPTIDAVPVVFCNKCEHWDRDWNPYGSNGNQHFCPMIGLVTDADFFCKDGEQKGGTE